MGLGRHLSAVAREVARRWRLLLLALVYGTAVVALMRVSTGGGGPHPWYEALYLALRLFILENDGLPGEGPAPWPTVLWLMYFAAPALTTAAIAEGVRRFRDVLDRPERRVRRMRDHYVIAGLGKHARLVIQHIHAERPDARFVIIDVDPDLGGSFEVAPGRAEPVLCGDMADPRVLAMAGLDRAVRFIALSADDLVNLDACVAAATIQQTAAHRNPAFKAIALIADVGLDLGVTEACRRHGIERLNPYQQAAEGMLNELRRDPEFAAGWEDSVVIAGFGRFGQMFAVELATKARPGEHSSVTVVDREASRKVELFRRRYAGGAVTLCPIDGDIEDPETVERAFQLCLARSGAAEPIILLATDDDAWNLANALLIGKVWQARATIVTRMFHLPAHLQSLTAGTRVKPYEFARLVKSAIRRTGVIAE